ncbi:MAG: NUDIX domain-containing protein [Firmicutes bacterium]|nr:NUDIX domain-containing protein [Bacillota bacterium]
MKQIKHIGAYGLIIKDDKILLIKKNGGPYDGKLDLPGGTIEFNETIETALVRELQEEVGVEITNYKLFDVVTTNIIWNHKNELLETKHIAILYIINEFKNDIKDTMEITEINDDSMGSEYYDIDKLKKEQLSNIALLALKKLGYK